MKRWLWISVLVVALGVMASAIGGETIRRSIEGNDMVVTLGPGGELFLEAKPEKGEGLWGFSRRLTGDTAAVDAISKANNRPRRLLSGVRYRVPYALLLDPLKVRVVAALFPGAEALPRGYRLTVPSDYAAIDLWQLSEWLTGSGENFAVLRRSNQLAGDNSLPGGSRLLVPRELLSPPFLALLPPPSAEPPPANPPPVAGSQHTAPPRNAPPPTQTPPTRPPFSDPRATDPPLIVVEPPTDEGTPSTAAPSAGSTDGLLRYESDARGRFGVYRLKKGEALYSAVVARFTGRITGKEVNELAAELARLNGIRDVTDMPVGQPVRIPLDMLLPEYLPPDDPKRQEWEADRLEVAKYSNTVLASRLEGITVVLDAGHGGDDPGVDHKGTWESVYVYDVAMRIKRLLEHATSARVVPTTRDGDSFRVIEKDVLPRSRGHVVLTRPEYAIRDAKVAANLRWYLANSHHRKAVASSRDSAKTIFISLHADSLHRSLRGSMIYVPSTSLTRGTYGKSGSVYLSRQEVKEKPRVSYSWKERTRSEGLSRQLADRLLGSFRQNGLRVHTEKPVRDRIIRCRRCRPFVPAVIRYNAVPTKVLLEICNMNNAEDRRLLRTRDFREKVAKAVVDGVLAYYGQPMLEAGQKVAAVEIDDRGSASSIEGWSAGSGIARGTLPANLRE